MASFNLTQAQAQMEDLLIRAAAGVEIIITRRKTPIARLVAVSNLPEVISGQKSKP
jgi:prevent-host-death family protein